MFTIYSADVTGNPGNCSYPHKHVILDEDSLKAANLAFCRSLCFALHYSMEVRLPFGRKNIRNFFEKKNRPLKNQRTTIHIRCSP